jgi:hypothetical protein
MKLTEERKNDTPMAAFLKGRWVLLTVLCVFIAFKIPHLFYPYYWDECWPYATAIKAMCEHGLSFMPDAIDAEISRGHPLFFHVIAAGWMKIFGASHLAMHSFALLISVLFLVAIFEAGLRMFNKRVAIMALLLVASLELFFVQSSFVLFEMLIAFLCFLSLWFYVKEKFVLTALCLTALFYTKESGLMMGFVLGLDALSFLFNRNFSRKEVLYRIMSVGVPCVMIGIFFLLQKYIRGWYIFPFYNEIIEKSWAIFWYKFRMGCLTATICSNLKYYYFLLLLLFALIAAIKNRRIRYLALFIPAACVYYFVDDMRAGRIMPSIPFFISFVVSWFWMLRVICHKALFAHSYQRRFMALTGCFVLVFVCFSTMNFFTYRYMLAAIVPLFICTAALLDFFISQIYKPLFAVTLVAIAVISYFAFTTNKINFGDADLGAFDAMKVQQDVVDYIEDNVPLNTPIGTAGYLAQQHLSLPSTGFLKKGSRYSNVKWEIDANTQIAVFNNIEPDYRYNSIKSDTAFYQLKRFEKGMVWAEIYRRK